MPARRHWGCRPPPTPTRTRSPCALPACRAPARYASRACRSRPARCLPLSASPQPLSSQPERRWATWERSTYSWKTAGAAVCWPAFRHHHCFEPAAGHGGSSPSADLHRRTRHHTAHRPGRRQADRDRPSRAQRSGALWRDDDPRRRSDPARAIAGLDLLAGARLQRSGGHIPISGGRWPRWPGSRVARYRGHGSRRSGGANGGGCAVGAASRERSDRGCRHLPSALPQFISGPIGTSGGARSCSHKAPPAAPHRRPRCSRRRHHSRFPATRRRAYRSCCSASTRRGGGTEEAGDAWLRYSRSRLA